MFLRFISVSIFSKCTYVTFCSPKVNVVRTNSRKWNLLETFLEKLCWIPYMFRIHVQNLVMFDIVKLHQRHLTCLRFLHFIRFSKISKIHCRCYKILKTTKLNVVGLCKTNLYVYFYKDCWWQRKCSSFCFVITLSFVKVQTERRILTYGKIHPANSR